MQRFIGHDGWTMLDNTSFYFANYFDWIMMQDKIIKKTETPRHVYIKTDYLNKYCNELKNINNDFILITGCSDYSPQINFKDTYLKIIDLPHLKNGILKIIYQIIQKCIR